MTSKLMARSSRPIVWSIAGSDCSGGAGIQADIKTAHSLGCEICTLITANTVQNSQSFMAMNATSTAILESQYQALILNKPPNIIKIGLLASLQQVEWLQKKITDLRQKKSKIIFVLDPVLKASVMQKEFNKSILPAYLELIKRVDVVTPNFDEALLLSQVITNAIVKQQILYNPKALASSLHDFFKVAVIVKGGHVSGKNSFDICIENDNKCQVSSLRIDTTFSHGGGCSFATAISCFLASELKLQDALVQAKAFMQKGFMLSQGKEQEYGAFLQPVWPVKKKYYPRVGFESLKAGFTTPYPSLNAENLGIYPVVDSIEWLEKLLPFNLKIIQLRLKNVSSSKLPRLVKIAVNLFKNTQTRLFINDHWQDAIEIGAYGVHLGQEDFAALTPKQKQIIKDSGIRLGLSSHGMYEYLLAEQESPSYIAMGAIFPSSSKNMSNQIQGIDRLKEICEIKNNIPLVAIGGINQTNLTSVLSTRVSGVAVISAITQSNQFKETLADMLKIYKNDS